MSRHMAINPGNGPQPVSVAEAQLGRIADQGIARHPYLNALLESSGRHAGRDLADAIHLLCHLHGNRPGLVEMALELSPPGAVHNWFERASNSFERERIYLVRLTAAVGPIPGTPGAGHTEATLSAARHALETLAMSERGGCALGAATALVGDWWPIRQILDRAAGRAGIECPAPLLPDENSVTGAIDAFADSPGSARALAFGGEQLLLQHRGLFDLLEARAEARGDY